MTWPWTTGCCSVTSPSRIYLPAASHGAKVITIQHGLSAGSVWCQTYQDANCTLSSTILRDSSIQWLPSSLFQKEKHTLKTVITLQSFRPKHMEISSELCHLEQLTTGHFINSQWCLQVQTPIGSSIWTQCGLLEASQTNMYVCMYEYKLISLTLISLSSQQQSSLGQASAISLSPDWWKIKSLSLKPPS